jgi:hypothetical protein
VVVAVDAQGFQHIVLCQATTKSPSALAAIAGLVCELVVNALIWSSDACATPALVKRRAKTSIDQKLGAEGLAGAREEAGDSSP